MVWFVAKENRLRFEGKVMMWSISENLEICRCGRGGAGEQKLRQSKDENVTPKPPTFQPRIRWMGILTKQDWAGLDWDSVPKGQHLKAKFGNFSYQIHFFHVVNYLFLLQLKALFHNPTPRIALSVDASVCDASVCNASVCDATVRGSHDLSARRARRTKSSKPEGSKKAWRAVD